MAVYPSVFLFVGAVAMAASWLAMQTRFDDGTRVLAGGFSLAAWGIWSFYALDVESAHRAVTHSYDGLMYLGGAAAAIMLLFTISAAFSMLRGTDGSSIDNMGDA